MSRRRVMDGPRRLGKEKLQHALRYAGSEAPRKGRQGYLGGIKSHIEALEKELADERAKSTERALQLGLVALALGMEGEWDIQGLIEEAYRRHDVVAALPKTADGVPVTVGMTLYSAQFICGHFRPPEVVVSLDAYADPEVSNWLGGGLGDDTLYSTREAADAAYNEKKAAEAAKEGETL